MLVFIVSLVEIIFSFVFVTVMYHNEIKTKGNEIRTKDTIEPQHIHKSNVMTIINIKTTHQKINTRENQVVPFPASENQHPSHSD